MNNDNNLNRPVRSSDYFVIATGFILNIASAIDALADDLHQLAVYHSNQKSQEDKSLAKIFARLRDFKGGNKWQEVH